jgi:hypothetical protein
MVPIEVIIVILSTPSRSELSLFSTSRNSTPLRLQLLVFRLDTVYGYIRSCKARIYTDLYGLTGRLRLGSEPMSQTASSEGLYS